MADQNGCRKRGRRRVSEAVKKQRQASKNAKKIYLGQEVYRWNAIKVEHSLGSDANVARFLIDRYYASKTSIPSTSAAGPSTSPSVQTMQLKKTSEMLEKTAFKSKGSAVAASSPENVADNLHTN
uniref:Uncharacterized protein LOC102809567 n=1 Tax=Saccoglossus kowalevskii TaxID=10224 RepID=A0ABM0MCU5_SACKO|nr:PREDICTED: uncharacterized protein LOC102809567 [Saccoglossus kowalevskii]